MPLPAPRVTEDANPLTRDLDAASPSQFLRLLCACDAQLFVGSDGLPGVHSVEVLSAAADAARAVGAALKHPRGRVVISGCGTSGRVAHLVACAFNRSTQSSRFHALLAGGYAALLVPAESIEDEPGAGADDLSTWAAREGVGAEDPVVVIGVSCGLSATYVASMLNATLTRRAWHPVAMGFNVLEAIAHVAVPGTGVTFSGVLTEVLRATSDGSTRGTLVNPIVGAEAVSGSSRMKGGTMTLLLLSALCEAGHALVLRGKHREDEGDEMGGGSFVKEHIRASLFQAEACVRGLYSKGSAALECVLTSASHALCALRVSAPPAPAPDVAPAPSPSYVTPSDTGRIFYLGRSFAGLLGLVDASEATDTYGSRFNDLRAFTVGGWSQMDVTPGAEDPFIPLELRSNSKGGGNSRSDDPPHEHACPDIRSFSTDFMPTLSSIDCVVGLWIPAVAGSGDAECEGVEGDVLLEALAAASAAGARVHLLAVGAAVTATSFVSRARALGATGLALDLDSSSGGLVCPPATPLLALKLALNAVSTGAHVARGVVVGNRMGNMMLTNHKLFLRARAIVSAVACVDADTARAALARAVHGLDDASAVSALLETEDRDPVAALAHIAVAAVTERVIPVALLLCLHHAEAGGGLTVEAARAALRRTPRVRDALAALKGE